MEADTRHPRARALKVTYLGLAVFFVVASAAVGLVTGDVDAALVGAGLGSLSFGLGVFGGAHTGITPRPVLASQSRTLALLLIASVGAGAALTALAAATGPTTPLLASLVLPLAAAGYSLFLVGR